MLSRVVGLFLVDEKNKVGTLFYKTSNCYGKILYSHIWRKDSLSRYDTYLKTFEAYLLQLCNANVIISESEFIQDMNLYWFTSSYRNKWEKWKLHPIFVCSLSSLDLYSFYILRVKTQDGAAVDDLLQQFHMNDKYSSPAQSSFNQIHSISVKDWGLNLHSENRIRLKAESRRLTASHKQNAKNTVSIVGCSLMKRAQILCRWCAILCHVLRILYRSLFWGNDMLRLEGSNRPHVG